VRNGEIKGMVNQLPDGWQIQKGSINFALKVEKTNQIDIKKVEIPLNETPYEPFEKQIYNVKTDQWESIQGKALCHIGQDQLAHYVTTGGEIVIRLINPTEQKWIAPIPYFQVEGVKKYAVEGPWPAATCSR
jgi:hypothetical protein